MAVELVGFGFGVKVYRWRVDGVQVERWSVHSSTGGVVRCSRGGVER